MFKVNFATLLIFNYGIIKSKAHDTKNQSILCLNFIQKKNRNLVERDLYLRGNVLPLKVEIVLGKVLTLQNLY